MESRVLPRGFDDFPTPPWAVRAFLRHAFFDPTAKSGTVLEPACGRGHMVKALAEVFPVVTGTDVKDYGFGYGVRDFLKEPFAIGSVDWIITNPPFVLAEEFVREGLRVAKKGVAILARASLAEGTRRYARLFRPFPPAYVVTYAERVPIVQSRIDRNASTATVYGWFVWTTPKALSCRHLWIPPCRAALEQDDDYVEGHAQAPPRAAAQS